MAQFFEQPDQVDGGVIVNEMDLDAAAGRAVFGQAREVVG